MTDDEMIEYGKTRRREAVVVVALVLRWYAPRRLAVPRRSDRWSVTDMLMAVVLAHRCGINPGGEVKGVEIDPARMARCPESYRMRLMDREEATGMKAVWG